MSLSWGVEAFGNNPEAVNIWIGDERSISSWHNDFYENLYGVVVGTKIFDLLPPTTKWKYSSCPRASFFKQTKNQKIVEKKNYYGTTHPVKDFPDWQIGYDALEYTPWIDHNPHETPEPAPLRVKVQAGEILYLPSLYYHRVTQTEMTIAVNYWHDMAYDAKYVYYNFIQNLQKEEARADM